MTDATEPCIIEIEGNYKFKVKEKILNDFCVKWAEIIELFEGGLCA